MQDNLFHKSVHYIDTVTDLRSRSQTLNFCTFIWYLNKSVSKKFPFIRRT